MLFKVTKKLKHFKFFISYESLQIDRNTIIFMSLPFSGLEGCYTV